jgi:hypothetical protein
MRFEFLPAFKGDCFLIHGGTDEAPFLILVDGGPAGTYEDHLRPRLMELRDARRLDDYDPLVIDLVIVSHVDDDHINGIIDLFEEIADAGNAPLFEVRSLWHNSFDDILGNDEVAVQAAQFGTAGFGPLIDEAETDEEFDAGLILQSVAQGQKLRDLAEKIGVPVNDGDGGLIKTVSGERTVHDLGGIAFTVVGPRTAELEALQAEHDEWLEEQRARGEPVTPASILQAMSDESVANLSSIVLLAEHDGRSVLLTGDARGDYVLKGLEEIGLTAPGGTLAVDLLKMPHHGSDRNVDAAFLQRIPARQYLFTGNGEHGNPERATFEMLLAARPEAGMDWYLTYKIDEIDSERRNEHDEARRKELEKQAAGKLKPPRQPRPAWTDAEHSVRAVLTNLPATVRAIEPAADVVEL